MGSKQNKQRTYARNRSVSRKGNFKPNESDGQYFLKLVAVLLLGTFWIKFSEPFSVGALYVGAIPVGAVLGYILVAKFEKSQFNRRIWYVVLLVATVISLIQPAGIVI